MHIVSITYYSFMALFAKFSKEFLSVYIKEFINNNVLYMNAAGVNPLLGILQGLQLVMLVEVLGLIKLMALYK